MAGEPRSQSTKRTWAIAVALMAFAGFTGTASAQAAPLPALDAVGGLVEQVSEPVADVLDEVRPVVDTALDVVEPVSEGVVEPVEDVTETVLEPVAPVIETVGEVLVPGSAPNEPGGANASDTPPSTGGTPSPQGPPSAAAPPSPGGTGPLTPPGVNPAGEGPPREPTDSQPSQPPAPAESPTAEQPPFSGGLSETAPPTPLPSVDLPSQPPTSTPASQAIAPSGIPTSPPPANEPTFTVVSQQDDTTATGPATDAAPGTTSPLAGMRPGDTALIALGSNEPNQLRPETPRWSDTASQAVSAIFYALLAVGLSLIAASAVPRRAYTHSMSVYAVDLRLKIAAFGTAVLLGAIAVQFLR